MRGITNVLNPRVGPAVRDMLDNVNEAGFQRYDSGWTRLEASATVSFSHGLREIPMVVQILESTDPQAVRRPPSLGNAGVNEQEAIDITTTKTGNVVTVTDTSAADPRYIRVRAF